MMWTPFLFALVVAFVIAVALVPLAGWRRPGAPESEAMVSSVLFFFAIVFFATWAGAVWLAPAGPVMWGAPWLIWLCFAVIVALIVGAVRPQPREALAEGPSADAAAASAGFGVLFWTLIAVLLVAAIGGSAWS